MVSPCEPTMAGSECRGWLAAYRRQFSFSSQTRKPAIPGSSRMVTVTSGIASTCGSTWVSRASSPVVKAGSNGSISLCAIVTVGKCLIGLI